jgi:hypothetical protein
MFKRRRANAATRGELQYDPPEPDDDQDARAMTNAAIQAAAMSGTRTMR